MDNIVLRSATILQDEMRRNYMYEHHNMAKLRGCGLTAKVEKWMNSESGDVDEQRKWMWMNRESGDVDEHHNMAKLQCMNIHIGA